MPCGCVLLAYAGLGQLLLSGGPRTVAFDIDQWSNESWGLHNIERFHFSGTAAIASDGSRANRIQTSHFKHYFFPAGSATVHTIWLKPRNVGYEIDNDQRITRQWNCTCTWEDGQAAHDRDADCSSAAKAQLGAGATRINSGAIAGVPVTWYREFHERGEDEAAFAPSFACDVLERRTAKYNRFRLPTFRFHFIVRSYRPGEPNSTEFMPPQAYKVIERRR